jgi:hypothetical protein
MSRETPISRRQMLGMLGSGLVVVVGFDPLNRRWVSQAEAASCPTFQDVPRLEASSSWTQRRATPPRMTRAISSLARHARCSGPARSKISGSSEFPVGRRRAGVTGSGC